ncbi:hypothetical protein [Humisphaera borealis]|uniref:Uncharacterized protein n=1 Tax=Humisphaera borealis TaxID=2807512 RepID=A0A7M2WRW0_9BACT|nr:hypothetical protein [Humisphaera borealis]QOV88173.1 hypothetical protein IPV69_18180 [Humisphaera borealis]
MTRIVQSIYFVSLAFQTAGVIAWALLAGAVLRPVGDLSLLFVIQLIAGGMSLGRPNDVSRAEDLGWSFGVSVVWATVGYVAYILTSAALNPGQPILGLPAFVAVVAFLLLGGWLLKAVM